MFQVDSGGSGPLTLEELQINLPDTVQWMLSEEELTCFYDEVERRAQEIGDPAELDPETQPYWNGEVSAEEWALQNNKMQRVLDTAEAENRIVSSLSGGALFRTPQLPGEGSPGGNGWTFLWTSV